MPSVIINSFYSTITTGSRFVANSLLFIIMARALGVEDFGIFTFAVTFASIFLVIIDYGFNLQIVREIAITNDSIQHLSNKMLNGKILLVMICSIILSMTVCIMRYQIDVIIITCIIWASFILYSFGLFYNSIFKGLNQFQYEAYSSIVLNLSQFVLICIILYLNIGIIYIALAYFVARCIYLLMSYQFVLKRLHKIHFSLDIRSGLKVLITSFPFGINAILAVIFLQLDTVLISYFKGAREVGLYQAPMRLLVAAMLINDIIASSYYPLLANKYIISRDEFKKIALCFNKYIIITGGIIACLFYNYADLTIGILFGSKYFRSIYLMQLLAAVVFLKFVGSSYALFITVADNQGFRALCVGFSLVLNIFLNIILIPKCGAVGAAIANILTQLFLCIILLSMSYRMNSCLILDKRTISGILLLTVGVIAQIVLKPYSIALATIAFVVMFVSILGTSLDADDRIRIGRKIISYIH